MRAKAAIIRPFQAVSTLSSRWGRGRASRAVNILARRLASTRLDLVLGFSGFLGELLDGPRGIEQVLAGELLLRIDGRVAAFLDAESPDHDRRILAEQRLDFCLRPQVEGAFGLVRVRLAGLLRRHAVGILGRIEAAASIGHLAHDVRQRVLGDVRIERVAGHLRGLEIREDELRLVVEHLLEVRHAPGSRRPNSGGSRRRCGRACRRAPSRAASPAPCRARAGRRCARARAAETAARSAVGTSARRRSRRAGVSNDCRNCETVRASALASGNSADAGTRSPFAAAPSRRRPTAGSCARSTSQTRAISRRMSTKPGRPHRDVGGKYVPP